MGYQIPKKDHPWRQYSNRKYKKTKEKKIKPVSVFVKEMAESWETLEVYTYAHGKEGKFNINELPQTKQAAWFAGILKRNYG